MKAIIYQYDEPPIILEDIEGDIEIEGEDIILTNYNGRTPVNINDVQEIRLVAK